MSCRPGFWSNIWSIRRLCVCDVTLERVPVTSPASEADDDFAAGLVRLHEPMGVLDLLEAENLRRLRPVGAFSDAVDNRLEWNFRKRKCRRTDDERARKDAQMGAARHLEHRIERKRIAAAEKSDETAWQRPPVPPSG